MKDNMEKLRRIAQRKKIHLKGQDPYFFCLNRLMELSETIVEILKIEDLKKNLKNLIFKQFYVNIITILEVFCKDFFIFAVDTLKLPFKKPIKDKFDINEIQFIAENNIATGEIIGEFLNFQNLYVIQSIYSEILDCDFLVKIDKLFREDKIMSKMFKPILPFPKEINRIINLRHEIIHEKSKTIKIEPELILMDITTVLTFTLGIYNLTMDYCIENSNDCVERGFDLQIIIQTPERMEKMIKRVLDFLHRMDVGLNQIRSNSK